MAAVARQLPPMGAMQRHRLHAHQRGSDLEQYWPALNSNTSALPLKTSSKLQQLMYRIHL